MRRGIVIAACFSLVAAAAAAGAPAPAVWIPDTDAGAAATLEGTTWIGDGGSWKIWIKQLDAAERLNFIERTTGFAIDPFAGRPGAPPAYLTFLLVIENRGTDGLSFNPQNAWVKSNRNQVLLPRGMADLSFNYRVTGREFPPAYERVQDALLDRALSIAAGERQAGLLVYDRVNDKAKRWSLGLRFTLPDGERATFVAPYRRADLKIKKKKKKDEGTSR